MKMRKILLMKKLSLNKPLILRKKLKKQEEFWQEATTFR